MSTKKGSAQKYVCLTFEKKIEILEKLMSGVTRKEIYEQYQCSPATLSRILKEKESIINLARQNKNISRKRLRKGSNKEVENALLIWFNQMRSKQAILTGRLLLEKAVYFAEQLNADFVPKVGWLERWKKRENIQLRNVNGEKALADSESANDWLENIFPCQFKNEHQEKNSADTESANDWLQNILPAYLEEYPADAIFNADETALFFKASGILTNKSEQVSRKKFPIDRISLLFVTNSTGTDKLIYSIGKSQAPSGFKKSIPYFSNATALMTSYIWTKIMEELDTKFKAIGKKVLLFVDNTACHKVVYGTVLENIKIVFLPAKTTSFIQPLDQGIIRSFKSQYRKRIVAKQHLHLKGGYSMEEFEKKIDFLETLNLVKLAWDNVKAETITNCFKKANFFPGNETDSFHEALGEEIDPFINIDENVDCLVELNDEDTIEKVSSVQNMEEAAESSEDDNVKPEKPTVKEALEYINNLKEYFGENSSALIKLQDLELIIYKEKLKNLGQE